MGMVVDSYRFAAPVDFDPETDITWSALWWAEGSEFDALNLSDGNAVATWPDESGTADLTQSTAGLRPSYVAADAAFNNQPLVSFASDWLSTASTSTVSAPWTWVMIVSATDTSSGAILDTDTPRQLVQRINSGSQWRWFQRVVDAGTFAAGTPYFAVGKEATGGNTIYANGTLQASGSGTTNGVGTGRLGINAVPSSGAGIPNGTTKVALLGLYSGDITADSAWEDFKTWVTSHYGITIA